MKLTHIMSILNILTDLCVIRQNVKKYFQKYCLQWFISENIFEKHKQICLKINSNEGANVKGVLINFKSKCKQLAVPLRVYADVESILKLLNTFRSLCLPEVN